MSISRTKNTQHKVYIPSSARENQYLMAKTRIFHPHFISNNLPS